jgi:hypothetical protein
MKSNRRDFLKTTAAAGATAATLHANATPAGSGPDAPREMDPAAALRLSIFGATPAQARPSKGTGIAKAIGGIGRRLNVQLSSHTPTPWMGDDIAVLTRYTPSPDGVALDALALPTEAPELHAFERHWSGRRNAVALGVEPFAMLVNTTKAARAGISGRTLGDHLDKGNLPRLPLTLDLSSGLNGWIHPLFAEFTGWAERSAADAPSLFLDDAALRGMQRLRQVLRQQVDAPLVASADSALGDLLDDDQPEVIASYGNPLTLAHRLGQPLAHAGFEVVSLQHFMSLRTPSLFRTASVQLGAYLYAPGASELLQRLDGAAARRALLAHLPHLAEPQHAALAVLPQDGAFYQRLPHLSVLADSRLMTALAIGLRRSADRGLDAPVADEACVLQAASQAYYELAAHEAREAGALSVARAAAPALALA